MKKIISQFVILLLAMQLGFAQPNTESLSILSYDSLRISGTLQWPKKVKEPLALAIIIAGSGPTDRDGNSGLVVNNSLKYLAEGLSKKDIASFRYDKRAIGKSLKGKMKESDIRFQNYIDDLIEIVNYFKNDERFNKIVIIGHSEGSLIGMIAARIAHADQFISISGVGRTADLILQDQLATKSSKHETKILLDSLKNGFEVKNLGSLKQLFRPSVQPYMMSWFKFNPVEEIAKLNCPILILQGDHDIQVKVSEAELLKAANPNSEMIIISNMNHVLKTIKGDFNDNIKSYYNPGLSISKELVLQISKFIKR